MAITSPVSLALFADTFCVSGFTFYPPQQKQISQTAAGEIIQGTIGPALWRGSMQLYGMRNADARGMRAKLSVLERADATFLLSDPHYKGPRADPGGVILGSAAVKIASVAVNNRDVSLTGLPSKYKLSAGDYLSFQRSGGRYSFHQIVSDGTATTTGTLTIEVTPQVRPGVPANVAVNLKAPVLKAFIMPSGVNPGTIGLVASSGLSFDWQQTLG